MVMLIIVWLSYIIYTGFYIKIQWVYRSDLKEIQNDFDSDFEIIKTKSGLAEDMIEKERSKIQRKLSISLSMIHWLIVIVALLGCIVSCYILYEITLLENSNQSLFILFNTKILFFFSSYGYIIHL